MNEKLILNMHQDIKIYISQLKNIDTTNIEKYLKKKEHKIVIKKICKILAEDILKDQNDFETFIEITIIHDHIYLNMCESYSFLKNTDLYTQPFGFNLNTETDVKKIKESLKVLIEELKIADKEFAEAA